jgi:hypothetical protein
MFATKVKSQRENCPAERMKLKHLAQQFDLKEKEEQQATFVNDHKIFEILIYAR